MTLDEAITSCMEVVSEEMESYREICPTAYVVSPACSVIASVHCQLAEWLIELKQRRKQPEVRHGRWECGGFCSECGLDNEERKTPFCPNCGADMREEVPTMADIELKPCPFCGEYPTVSFNDDKINKWNVQCNNPKCRIQPMTDYHRCKSVVVREWNRRVDNG